MLNIKKPYMTVYGRPGAIYEQHSKFYDIDGYEVGVEEPKPVEVVKEQPALVKIVPLEAKPERVERIDKIVGKVDENAELNKLKERMVITDNTHKDYLSRPEIMRMLKDLKQKNSEFEYSYKDDRDALLATLKGVLNVEA